MRRAITILFSVWTLSVFGQSDQQIIDRIEHTWDNDSLDFAKAEFENFIVNHSSSLYTIRAKFFLADIAERAGDSVSTFKYYSEIINMVVPDSVDQNFRNTSAKKLADFYIERKDYKIALKYLNLAKKKFTYKSFCGNAYAADDINMADKYSDCYIGQANYKKAIDVLCPLMFNNRLADNSELIQKLYSTYRKVYSKEQIKNEFLNSDKTLVMKKEKYKNGFYYRPLIKIFNHQIFVTVFEFEWGEISGKQLTDKERLEKTIETIKKSEIYQLTTI